MIQLIPQFFEPNQQYKMKLVQDQDFKKKREQFTVNLRKANRQEILMKKRNFDQLNTTGNKEKKKQIIVDESLHTYISTILKQQFDVKQTIQLLNLLDSTDIIMKHRAVIGLRKLTAQNTQYLSQLIIKHNLVDKLIGIYNQNAYPQIKLQLLWAFTNLTSVSKQFTIQLVQHKIISLLTEDMLHQNQAIQYHAIWTAGNIAAENTTYRDQLLLFGSIYKVIKYLQQKRSQNQIVTAVWVLTNLSRGHPAPKYDAVKFVVAPIAQALKGNIIKSQSIISDCLWTLANLSEGGKVHVQRIAQTQCLQKIIQYLVHPQLPISIPAVRIVGNFTNGTKQQTNLALKYNFFDKALVLLDKSKDTIVKQICWAISNITAGTDQQMLQFLQRQDLIQKLLQIFPTKIWEIKAQIIWIFTNLQNCQTEDLILNLFDAIGILRMIGQQLQQQSQKCLLDALTCLYRVFLLGDRQKQEQQQNRLVINFCKLGYAPLLQVLQKHDSSKIYRQCNKILQRFFNLSQSRMQDV